MQKLEDTDVSRSGIKCCVISVIIQFAITTKKQGNKDNESFMVVYESNTNTTIACIGTYYRKITVRVNILQTLQIVRD